MNNLIHFPVRLFILNSKVGRVACEFRLAFHFLLRGQNSLTMFSAASPAIEVAIALIYLPAVRSAPGCH